MEKNNTVYVKQIAVQVTSPQETAAIFDTVDHQMSSKTFIAERPRHWRTKYNILELRRTPSLGSPQRRSCLPRVQWREMQLIMEDGAPKLWGSIPLIAIIHSKEEWLYYWKLYIGQVLKTLKAHRFTINFKLWCSNYSSYSVVSSNT